MQRLGKYLFLLAATTIGLGLLPNQAQASSLVTVTPQPTLTDIAFNNLINTGKFTEVFVAQSRIGNNATNGTQEIDLLNPRNNLMPVAQEQRQWVSGQAVNFSLEYTGSMVNYIVGDQIISSKAFSGSVTDIFLRTRAADGSSMKLTDLVLNGQSLGFLESQGNGGSDVDYLTISKLPSSFTLTGKQTMSWGATRPGNSHLAYQIKVGTTPPNQSVPEPGTIGALVLTGMAFVGSRKKMKNSL